MKICLLYKDKEFESGNSYSYKEDVIKDLNLDVVFKAMARNDEYIFQTVRSVMMSPISDVFTIRFRQEMVEDCIKNQESYRGFYRIVTRAMSEIQNYKENVEKREKGLKTHTMAIYSSLEILLILVRSMEELKEHIMRTDSEYTSTGMKLFCKRMNEEYNVRLEEEIKKSIQDMIFLNQGGRIHLNASIGQGMRGSEYSVAELMQIAAKPKKGMGDKVKNAYYRLFRRNVILLNHSSLIHDARELEQGGLHHVLTMYQGFIKEYTAFFENVRFQTAFYVGCIHLYNKLDQIKVKVCTPRVNLNEGDPLRFENLYEPSLAILSGKAPVPNDYAMGGKKLVIISGANQGGKSTYLRSIGIAQIFMQCGMLVPAQAYASHLYDNVFTHFTRREDQALNSGRLDEELKRMKRIIVDVTPKSLLLFNESFASTTEKEGSIIARDITKALYEADIRVFMVTHLYEFIKNLYEEGLNQAVFLSAERKEDGTRTYRVLEAEPSYTSYGMDLYKEIMGG